MHGVLLYFFGNEPITRERERNRGERDNDKKGTDHPSKDFLLIAGTHSVHIVNQYAAFFFCFLFNYLCCPLSVTL